MKYFVCLRSGLSYSIDGRVFLKDQIQEVSESLYNYLISKKEFEGSILEDPTGKIDVSQPPKLTRVQGEEVANAPEDIEANIQRESESKGGPIEVSDLPVDHRPRRKMQYGKGK